MWIVLIADQQRASPCCIRPPQRYVPRAVDDKVTVGLEIESTGTVDAVGRYLVGRPFDGFRIRRAEKDEVTVAVEVDGGAEVDAADVVGSGDLECSGCPCYVVDCMS